MTSLIAVASAWRAVNRISPTAVVLSKHGDDICRPKPLDFRTAFEDRGGPQGLRHRLNI